MNEEDNKIDTKNDGTKSNTHIYILIALIIIIVLLFIACIFINRTINYNILENTSTNDANLNTNVLTNKEANTIVIEIMDKFYTEVFYGHKETYCGEYDNNDIIDEMYYKSTTYNNVNELKNHLISYMSTELVDKILSNNETPKYKELNNKLYCLRIGRGGLIYDKDNTIYNISNITETKITGTGMVSSKTEGNEPQEIKVNLTFEKINNKWVLTSYSEQ